MRTTITWTGLILGLALAISPVSAQQQLWYVPHVDEAKTPIEMKLQSPELAMPGFGIGSTRATIIKRFEYALDHKWLSSAQVEKFCNDLKQITDKEQAQRDSSGKLPFEARTQLAKQLSELNDNFEETVLVREQSSPGIEGLQARRAMMIQRVNQAVAEGKMTHKKAQDLKAEIAAASAQMPEKDLSEELSHKIAGNLNKINVVIEKDLRGPSIANRVVPFSR
ncbi:MAG: hypothetical protein K2X27_23205 [Candidatus Obscuribacterales bacterium]|nr:hypothetical protein [Candidatus Obscuribacterales bacterium]